jgi:hypothetical protein
LTRFIIFDLSCSEVEISDLALVAGQTILSCLTFGEWKSSFLYIGGACLKGEEEMSARPIKIRSCAISLDQPSPFGGEAT